VHALKRDWLQLMSVAGEGVAWVFSPTRCAGQALSLIGLYRIAALVCISAKEGLLEKVSCISLQSKELKCQRLMAYLVQLPAACQA
jgi:hypothetical protein